MKHYRSLVDGALAELMPRLGPYVFARGDEGFLHDVERFVVVTDDARDEPMQWILVTAHDFSERQLTSTKAQGDQLAVRAVGKCVGHRASSVSALVTAASNFAA